VACIGSAEAVATALRLAVRAPSVHNCQPWRWLVGPGTVHLYVDGARQVPATDPHGRDLLISCGAALNHLLVALASLGWDARVRRMPNPARPGHVATVQPFPHTATSVQNDLAAAIPRRRTDRRRFSSWPVPAELIGEMLELAHVYGVGLEAITEPALRWKVFRAITTAAEQQAADPAYAAEIAAWSGRGTESDDGVPAASAPVPQHAPGQMPLRDYARPNLALPPPTGEPENATVLLLTTPTDNAMDWLRAGEATSAILLTATRHGLASSPLTQPLEVDDTREFIRSRVATAHRAHPQILLRIGWASAGAEELPLTPRRSLDDVVALLDE
jgi:nitroreductase